MKRVSKHWSVVMLTCAFVGVVAAQGSAAAKSSGSRVCPLSSRGEPGSMSSAVIAHRPAIYTLPAGCGPAGKKLQCNPLTNLGCDRAKGEACDDDEHGGFGCYAGPNPVGEGGECNDEAGCQGGLGCDMDDDDDGGACARYCCSDADCGSKKCVTIDKAFGSLGFCH